MGRGRPGALRADPAPGALELPRGLERSDSCRRSLVLGGKRHRGQDPTQAPRGRPVLHDRVADAPGLAGPDRVRCRHLVGPAGMDGHLHRRPGLRCDPREHGGLAPLALHPACAPGGHRRPGHSSDPGDRDRGRLDPVGRTADPERRIGDDRDRERPPSHRDVGDRERTEAEGGCLCGDGARRPPTESPPRRPGGGST